MDSTAQEMSRFIHSAFLKIRAMPCVVLPHLGGDGPSLGSHQLQREIVAGQVTKLLEVAGPSGKGLLRMNPDHELIIGISGKSIDNNSLSMTPRVHLTMLDSLMLPRAPSPLSLQDSTGLKHSINSCKTQSRNRSM